MLTCSACGERPPLASAFLIRNLCSECAPALHERYGRIMALLALAENDFTVLTGQNALERWYRFEEFLLGWSRARELASLIEADGVGGPPC